MDEQRSFDRIADMAKTIFAWCAARTRSRAEAEDLSQEILCELFASVKNLHDEAAFYGFMWKTAGNVYRHWVRKAARSRTREPAREAAWEDRYPSLKDREDIARLRRELALLSRQHRQAVILYYAQEQTCAKIARRLSVSEGMVKYLLFHTRQKLKEGMTMTRETGILSYAPKTLLPLYCGQGPNQFWTFMNSRIRQNILCACYYAAMRPEEISLEMGVPLPYLEDDLEAMAEKGILCRTGARYQAKVLVLTEQCQREVTGQIKEDVNALAEEIGEYLPRAMPEYRAIGFSGSGFSENTLRWLLAGLIFCRMLEMLADEEKDAPPVTAWGERAYIWCAETGEESWIECFRRCSVGGRRGDELRFFEYLGGPGNMRDFYGNQRKIDLLFDVLRGEAAFSEYDRETVAGMEKEGYLTDENGGYHLNLPVYTREQLSRAQALAAGAIGSAVPLIVEKATRIIVAHAPKSLRKSAGAIGRQSLTGFLLSPLAKRLIERGALSEDFREGEIANAYIVRA